MKHPREIWLSLLALGVAGMVAIAPASAQRQLEGQVRRATMKRRFPGLRMATASLLMIFGYAIPQAEAYNMPPAPEGQPVLTDAGKPAYNIIFVISDQRSYRLFAGNDYSLPALDTIARHGVTFRNGRLT
jgi:hypothetical protein